VDAHDEVFQFRVALQFGQDAALQADIRVDLVTGRSRATDREEQGGAAEQ
jgi:hypothetical protein